MAKLLLCPLRAGYSAQQRTGVLQVELDGGASRYRSDILNGAFLVEAAWSCNEEQYDYLCAFHRTATEAGALPFDIDLKLDSSQMVEYEAHFVPGTFRTPMFGDGRYRVEAVLEIVKPYDPGEGSSDEAIISAFEAAHGGGES